MGTKKHGLTGTDIYRVYRGIKFRCTNTEDYHAKYYVNRGITMCEEWLNNPKTFCDWAIENGYKKGLTIDRIDNNKGYSPDNCRWATVKEQSNNRRNNTLVEVDGITKTLSQWSEETGIHLSTLRRNYKKGLRGREFLKPEKYHCTFSKIAQYSLNGDLMRIWNSLAQIQTETGFCQTHIASVCKHKNNCHTAYGFGWSYYPEDIWIPEKLHKRPCKTITIGSRSGTYKDWAKLLKISEDHFRHIYYKIKNSSKEMELFIRKHNL